MTNESDKLSSRGIRLEVLKHAKEMVRDRWYMEKEELQSYANFEKVSPDMPPLPTTHEVLEVASDFYNFVENDGKSS
jgi:hypothetical protein